MQNLEEKEGKYFLFLNLLLLGGWVNFHKMGIKIIIVGSQSLENRIVTGYIFMLILIKKMTL
jgi:hypothetical protein